MNTPIIRLNSCHVHVHFLQTDLIVSFSSLCTTHRRLEKRRKRVERERKKGDRFLDRSKSFVVHVTNIKLTFPHSLYPFSHFAKTCLLVTVKLSISKYIVVHSI
jgi:hypothetical protein